MTNTEDDAATDILIREVTEDLRQDRMVELWRRYGIVIAVAVVAIVMSVAGWQVWQKWELKQAIASSDRFVAALALNDTGKTEQALKDLTDLEATGSHGYRLLARLARAEIMVAANDTNGAVMAYQSVIDDSGSEMVYRDMARLKAAYLSLDTADPALIDRLVSPLDKEGNPWRFAAREVQALSALKRGETTRAVELFKGLADDVASQPGIRGRAAEMLKILQPKSNG